MKNKTKWSPTDPKHFEGKTLSELKDQLVKAEKFAVLVINETINWIHVNVGYVDASARADLMKHFGVE